VFFVSLPLDFHFLSAVYAVFRLSPNLISHHDMKTYGVVGVQLPSFSTSTLDEGELLDSRSTSRIPRERAVDTHWIGYWIGPGAGLDKKKVSVPPRIEKSELPRLLDTPL
jgi:hypothetical protein